MSTEKAMQIKPSSINAARQVAVGGTLFQDAQPRHPGIDHGRVKLNGDRVKPAREVKPGDRLELTW